MRIGYCVPITPHMASFRLRVAIPAPLLGCDYEIGCAGEVTFFYKHFAADLELARSSAPFVYDVVNDHFASREFGNHYRAMCAEAAAVTCSSPAMADTVARYTGRKAIVIDDPYENAESPPRCAGNEVLWFGHGANVSSLTRVISAIEDLPILLNVISNFRYPEVIEWSPDAERRGLERSALCLLTGNNSGASTNRVVKALRAGRFVVTPGGIESWEALRPYVWIGDVREGIQWALANPEEVCAKITAGQEYLREANAPQKIARQWMDVFDSISGRVTSDNRVGSASTIETATVTS